MQKWLTMSLFLTEVSPTQLSDFIHKRYETSHVIKICCIVSTSKLHIEHKLQETITPLFSRLTLDGSLFNSALQPKTFADPRTMRSQISLHHSSGLTSASYWALYPDWIAYRVVSSPIQLHVSTLNLLINAMNWFFNSFSHSNKSLLHGNCHI